MGHYVPSSSIAMLIVISTLFFTLIVIEKNLRQITSRNSQSPFQNKTCGGQKMNSNVNGINRMEKLKNRDIHRLVDNGKTKIGTYWILLMKLSN